MLENTSSTNARPAYDAMVGHSRSVATQTTGPRFRITDEWRLSVRKWLEANQRPQAWLASELTKRGHAATAAALSLILHTEAECMEARPRQKPIWSTKLAPGIAEITGVPIPSNSN